MSAKLIIPLAVAAALVTGGSASAQQRLVKPAPQFKPNHSAPYFTPKPIFPPVYVAPKPVFFPPVYKPPVYVTPKPVFGFPYWSPDYPGYSGWFSPWFKW